LTQVIYSRRALADLERLADFLCTEAPRAAVAAIDVIIDGVDHSYESADDVALILAIRHPAGGGIYWRSVKNPRRDFSLVQIP
jgi:hypothetical protein